MEAARGKLKQQNNKSENDKLIMNSAVAFFFRIWGNTFINRVWKLCRELSLLALVTFLQLINAAMVIKFPKKPKIIMKIQAKQAKSSKFVDSFSNRTGFSAISFIGFTNCSSIYHHFVLPSWRRSMFKNMKWTSDFGNKILKLQFVWAKSSSILKIEQMLTISFVIKSR